MKPKAHPMDQRSVRSLLERERLSHKGILAVHLLPGAPSSYFVDGYSGENSSRAIPDQNRNFAELKKEGSFTVESGSAERSSCAAVSV
jgi:hypothetical protein